MTAQQSNRFVFSVPTLVLAFFTVAMRKPARRVDADREISLEPSCGGQPSVLSLRTVLLRSI
jgi:hypothetical protein